MELWKRKYEFYKAWFFSLSDQEQQEFIGRWILDRCNIFCTMIESSQDQKLKKLGIGNYKFSDS
jgi:hypothetical protein